MSIVARDLTPDEEEQSRCGPKFAEVTWQQLWTGPKPDGDLAQQIMRMNPRRYKELRTEYLINTRQMKRPDPLD